MSFLRKLHRILQHLGKNSHYSKWYDEEVMISDDKGLIRVSYDYLGSLRIEFIQVLAITSIGYLCHRRDDEREWNEEIEVDGLKLRIIGYYSARTKPDNPQLKEYLEIRNIHFYKWNPDVRQILKLIFMFL